MKASLLHLLPNILLFLAFTNNLSYPNHSLGRGLCRHRREGHPTSWWGWGGPSWVSCLLATPDFSMGVHSPENG